MTTSIWKKWCQTKCNEMKQQYPNKMKPHLLDKLSYRRILLLHFLKMLGGCFGII